MSISFLESLREVFLSVFSMNLSAHPWLEPVTRQIKSLMAANNARYPHAALSNVDACSRFIFLVLMLNFSVAGSTGIDAGISGSGAPAHPAQSARAF
jgi:hypothetical protein